MPNADVLFYCVFFPPNFSRSIPHNGNEYGFKMLHFHLLYSDPNLRVNWSYYNYCLGLICQWSCGNCQSFDIALIIASPDPKVAPLSPLRSPGVLNDPVLFTLLRIVAFVAIPYNGDNVVSGLPWVESVVHRDVVVDTPAVEEEIVVNLEADSDRSAAEELQAH